MKLNSKVYDIAKWIVMLVLPALSVLIETIGNIYNIGMTREISLTISAITLFLGSILGVSALGYNNNEESTEK